MRISSDDDRSVAENRMAAANGSRPSRRSHARPQRSHRQAHRRCILTGKTASVSELIRLAVGLDGAVMPDILAKAPGRGAWIGLNHNKLSLAVTKGKLRTALVRSLKQSTISVALDLADRIAEGLARATLDRLGLEARAGTLIVGTGRIEAAARKGHLAFLLHASDASSDSIRKLTQARRAGASSANCQSLQRKTVILPVDRQMLSMALGRENTVHLALIDENAAQRVMALLNRWQFFIG